ncbi:MAG: YceI family protein [Bacteroidales bacterium]|nr:YceI family protein [Bacteroidales bacterium]HOK97785.1 YceI family protein [Bacteroidales bacterium]HPO64599.1 YceI family protein [Bacteroidales bacterium]
MIKKTIFLLLLPFVTISLPAQKYITTEGNISFFSSTPFEDIKAENKKVIAILDMQTGEVAVSCIMKMFHFERALMEEHFNENYVESHKFPKATFKGKIANTSVLSNKNMEQETEVEGIMNIHGVDQPFRAKVKMTPANEQITVKSEFEISPADYGIKIPQLVRTKIAEKIQVKVNLTLKKQ